MIPILYESITAPIVPDHYGLGSLTDCLSCEVTEERNGIYTLTLTYPATGIHADEIAVERFLKVKPNYMDDPQLFRIYRVGKVMAGKFTVYARHISYDMSDLVITGGSASSCASACVLLTQSAGNFTITTDKATAGNFTVSQPSSVRSWFGGKKGSLLDVYGGEWHYDNFGAKLKAARGADRNVTIRYGKNLTALNQIIDTSNLLTGILPFYMDQNGNKVIGAIVPTGLTLDRPRVAAIDFTQDVNPESSTPIATQLANLATSYKNNNNLTTPINSITLDFVQMKELTERVDLCDTVSIYFEALGIEARAKCVKVVWDVLEERYTKTTFGDARTNIADTLAAQAKELVNTPTKAEMNRATQLITGNLGGYVILHDSDGDGLPDEILIMDTPDINTAEKCWRWNKQGLGYSDSGYQGPYGLAMTSDGEINANFIKAGIISDAQGNSTINMRTGTASLWTLSAKGSFRIKNGTSGKTLGIYFPYDAGGAFQLNNANEEGRANLFVNANGSYLYLYAPDGTQLVTLTTSSAGAGLNMNDASGTPLVNVHTSNGGAGLVLNNTSGTKNIDIHSETNSGVISIENSAGKSVVHGWGNPGGWFQVRDGSENTTIELNGNNGGIICVSVTQTSSRKVKENIKPMEDSAKILELEPVSFDYKNEALGTNKRGFIAEDVAKILPNLVTPETDDKPATLDYISMIPYLQDIIKKQEARITALEEKINQIGG